MELTALWHYARPELAKRYLDLLDTGLVTSTTIFAPRRTGKTQFLRLDLSPAAERNGYRVVYADLWQTNRSPGNALIHALQDAGLPQTVLQKLAAGMKTPVKGIKAKAEVPGGSLQGEVELDTQGGKAQTETALLMDALIAELIKKKPLLLLVDEAQALARNHAGEDVARALRTAMTKHARGLRVVFTGSSRTKLGHVFSNANAPLYSAGIGIQDFPFLDRDFVDYIIERFHAATRRRLDARAAWAAFDRFDRRPEPFLHAVLALTLEPAMSFDQALTRVAEAQAFRENHEGVWQALDGLERALVRMLADDVTSKPFAKPQLERLRQIVGISDIRETHVQKALRRLSDKNIVVRAPRGVFEFENERFADWVRNLAD